MRKSFSTISLSSTGSSVSSETEYRCSYDRVPPKPTNLRLSTLNSKMDIPKPHSAAYNRRNQTTYSWYSQSCPSESFFRQMNSSGMRYNSPSPSTPSSGARSPASSIRSPTKNPNYTKITEQKIKKQSRPPSSYSYDGGLFCNFTPRADYFVIDPEWVSEYETIKKLSTDRKPRSKTVAVRRRCKSAPPPKRRNPITWEQEN